MSQLSLNNSATLKLSITVTESEASEKYDEPTHKKKQIQKK